MKKIAFLIIIMLLISVGCDSANKDPEKNMNSSSNNSVDNNVDNNVDNKDDKQKDNINTLEKNQKYSFGPIADLSKIDSATKAKLQDYLNKLGNPEKDTIGFKIIDGYFQEDGTLVLDLFIRNGYDYSIANIESDLEIVNEGKVIASANFELSEEEFGVLKSNESRPWTILFYPEDIVNTETEQKSFEIKARDILFEHIEES